MRSFLIMILIFVAYIFCCNAKAETRHQAMPIYSSVKLVFPNVLKTHELIIRGNEMLGKVFPDKICIKKTGDSKEIEFRPYDIVALQQSGPDLSNAWSPNGNFLVLPIGRFEGFTVFNIDDLPSAIAQGKGKRSIAVKDKFGIKFWHEFGGWKNEVTIRFSAGLSNDQFRFEWNVETGELISLDLKDRDYSVVNP